MFAQLTRRFTTSKNHKQCKVTINSNIKEFFKIFQQFFMETVLYKSCFKLDYQTALRATFFPNIFITCSDYSKNLFFSEHLFLQTSFSGYLFTVDYVF